MITPIDKETPMSDQSDLIIATADIVAAHVSNNNVAVSDMPLLVQKVHEALAGLQRPSEEPELKKTPVVSIRASVKPDYIVCLECGRQQKTLRRHLMTAHGLTPEQYRKDYGLPATYPLTAPNYSETRRQMAKAIGLGRKREPARATRQPRSGGTRRTSGKPRKKQGEG
jgi:predicted transcriptional regulator